MAEKPDENNCQSSQLGEDDLQRMEGESKPENTKNKPRGA